MEQIMPKNKRTNLVYILAGLGGVSLVIIIHELGHFLFAKLFGVPTPIFSLGFGPALFSLPIGETVFQLALLPFGGYVEMSPEALAAQPYLPKILIISAGILFNLIFAYCVFLYYGIRNQSTLKSSIQALTHSSAAEEEKQTAENDTQGTVVGPIGIISMMGKSLAINRELFWLMLAVVSLNIGLFNILPLPFFDGGKALIYTIEAVTGTTISPTFLWYITMIFLALFMFFIARVTMNDVKRLSGK